MKEAAETSIQQLGKRVCSMRLDSFKDSFNLRFLIDTTYVDNVVNSYLIIRYIALVRTALSIEEPAANSSSRGAVA